MLAGVSRGRLETAVPAPPRLLLPPNDMPPGAHTKPGNGVFEHTLTVRPHNPIGSGLFLTAHKI